MHISPTKAGSAVHSMLAAFAILGLAGCAMAAPPIVFDDSAPIPIESATEGQFPSVEIVNTFKPPGESNVRTSFALESGSALIGTEETGDIFKTTDGGMTWRKTTDGGDLWTIQDVREIIRAKDGHLYATTSEPALILRSQDNGESWTIMAEAKSSRTVGIVQLEDGAILAGLRRSENDKISVIRSDDYFETFDWIPVSADLPRQNVTCFRSLGGSSVLAGIGYEASGKIFKSADSGKTWKQTGEFEDARDVMGFFEDDGVIYVMTSGIATLFASADEGESWQPARKFWPKGFLGSSAEIDWNGKSFRIMPGTDQTNKTPRHVVLITGDDGKSWYEWIELPFDADEEKGGGASNCAVVDNNTIIVGVGNHAVQGRCYTLRMQ